MATAKHNLDDIDRKIILELQEDARRQFKIIARKLNVSEGTIKNRVTRLQNRGILKLEARVNPFALPNTISALIGVNLKERNHEKKIKEIEKIMNDQTAIDPNLQCITAITPTICKLMGIAPPALSDKRFLGEVVQAAGRDGISSVEKCLVYAPDAIGLQMYQNFRSLFDAVLRHAPLAVPLSAVIPPITPTCFASMFTGAQPRIHGLQKKGKPVLTCDTIFDALIRAGKRVAIVSAKKQSMDLIFRKRKIQYFSELDDQAVTQRTIEIIKSDNYDFIVAYHCEYDDILHEETPYCTAAIQALNNHIAAFTQLADTMDVFWRRNKRAIVFAPDHGAHIDPENGKGTHGNNISQDMHIQHYFGIKSGN